LELNNNQLGRVIRLEMQRNQMGNRGSKSNILPSSNMIKGSGRGVNSIFVKEQRADGSWLLRNNLRCALLDYESIYIAKILSKVSLTARNYSSNSINHNNNENNSNLS
jgi:hypothetical protein